MGIEAILNQHKKIYLIITFYCIKQEYNLIISII